MSVRDIAYAPAMADGGDKLAVAPNKRLMKDPQ